MSEPSLRGNSGMKKADHQKLKQNQFGLKEAYTVLQNDYLEVKKAFIANQQQVVIMQEQYVILQQSYQQLQQECQEQEAKLLEKLEKSYEVYREKFTRVEELEETLNECRKDLENCNENKANIASLQDQLSQTNNQRRRFQEAVVASLANAGLAFVVLNDTFELNILDSTKLKRFAGFNGDCNNDPKSKKWAELEQENAYLQATLLSLKEFSEKQRNDLRRANDMVQSKTEECLNLRKGIQKHRKDEAILVGKTDLARIVFGLSQMSDFVVELKRTIYDQNSWIEMLSKALNEYRKSQIAKDGKGKSGAHSVSISKPLNVIASRAETHSVTSGKKNKPKKKAQNGGQKISEKQPDNHRKTSSGYQCSPPGYKSPLEPVVEMPVGLDNEQLDLCEGFVYVPSRNYSQHVPSRHQQLGHMSSLSTSSREVTKEHLETGKPAQTFSRDARNDGPCEPPKAATDENSCPICDRVFEINCDVGKRRRHINSHFGE